MDWIWSGSLRSRNPSRSSAEKSVLLVRKLEICKPCSKSPILDPANLTLYDDALLDASGALL